MQNAPFCPISTPAPWNAEPIPLGSGLNFNPRNTQCIPACPVGPADRTGVVKIFLFLELKQKLSFFKGLNYVLINRLISLCPKAEQCLKSNEFI
jgi:hypothetical protein